MSLVTPMQQHVIQSNGRLYDTHFPLCSADGAAAHSIISLARLSCSLWRAIPRSYERAAGGVLEGEVRSAADVLDMYLSIRAVLVAADASLQLPCREEGSARVRASSSRSQAARWPCKSAGEHAAAAAVSYECMK